MPEAIRMPSGRRLDVDPQSFAPAPRVSLWSRARERVQLVAGTLSTRLAAFAYTAPPVPGMQGPGAAARLRHDTQAQALAESRDARYGRLTYGAGPAPARYSTYPASGLTPERIHSIFVQAEISGICWSKADLTLQILRRDSHLRAVDHSVRVRISGADWRIKPYDSSDLAQVVARYVRAWWDQIDGLDEALYGLLLANADGYALRETVDEWSKVRFKGTTGEELTVWGDHPRQLDFVHNKHVQFDPTTDEPFINVGTGKFIALPKGKIVWHSALGDGIIETRGHIQATSYLHCISHNAVARWAIYLAQRGLPHVAYVVDRAAYQDMERRIQYEEMVANIGNGVPCVVTDEGEWKITPVGTEAGAQGIHAAMIGWSQNEKSKAVQGEQLTTEVGVGGAGYNTSETQAQVQDAWVRAKGKRLAGDLRSGLVAAVLWKNGAALSRVLGRSIEDIVAVAPRLIPHTQRPLSPAVLVDVAEKIKNGLGVDVDEDEVREIVGLNPPQPGNAAPGRATILPKGAAAVPAGAAQDGGVVNPDLGDVGTGHTPATAPNTQTPPFEEIPDIELTSTDLGAIITVNEARASKGLPPLDKDGDITIAEYKAKHSGVVAQTDAAEDGKTALGMAAFAAGHDRNADPGVMIALYPPPELAAQLALPSGEPAAELHITLAYLGKRSKLPMPLESVQAELGKVNGSALVGAIGGVVRFPASETSGGLDPFCAGVDVPGLVELRMAVVRATEASGASVVQFHGWTPHLTLAYLDASAPSPLHRLAPLPVRFTEFWLVCGEQRQRFPLTEEPNVSSV